MATVTVEKNVEVIAPKSEAEWLNLRAKDITSTEVSALFGVSPYTTLFELWWRKKDGNVIELEPNERMKWGTRLQDSIAQGIAEDNGWKIRRMPEYIRNPALRMGASFDFAIEPDCECGHRSDDHSPIDGCVVDMAGMGTPCGCKVPVEVNAGGLLEIKNVDNLAYRDGWAVDGENIEAPPHIEIQVQHQLAVSGRAFAYIGALVGGNKLILIKREPDAKIIEAIKSQVASFWFTVAAGNEPVPDFSRDAKFIARLYNYADPNKVLRVHDDAEIALLADRYRDAVANEKFAKEAKEGLKAQILMKIGDAEKVFGDGYTVSAGLIGPKLIEAYERKGYRDFRINFKKSKEDK